MKLDRHIIDLMTLFEKAGQFDSYTFIPQLIREEIAEFRIKPVYRKDADGYMTSVVLTFEVDEYERKAS